MSREVPPPIGAIVPAAGSSQRMGGINKQFARLRGMPVLAHTVRALQSGQSLGIQSIVVALAAADFDLFAEQVAPHLLATPPVIVAAGGETRQQSVSLALAELPADIEFVVVHDGARPFVSHSLLARCIALATAEHKCTVAALPVTDTIKIAASRMTEAAGEQLLVQSTPDRSRMWAAQTPQVFPASVLRRAHAAAAATGAHAATDDAALVEAMGEPVLLVPGEEMNIKITKPLDLSLAELYFDLRTAAAAGANQ